MMKSNMSSYSHLLAKLSVVLAAVIVAAFVNKTDAPAMAGAGSPTGSTPDGEYEALVLEPDPDRDQPEEGMTSLMNRDKTAANSDNRSNGPDSAENAGNGKGSGWASIFGISDPAGDLPGDGDDDYPAQEDINGEDSGSPGEEPPDGETRTDEGQLPDEEIQADDGQLAEEETGESDDHKNTQEYIDSLLVTHPDHYNAAVVERARSLPTDSDNDRYLYITGVDKRIYTVGHMPEGYRSDAESSGKQVTIDVPVWKMTAGGEKYSSYWPLTINEKLADSIRCIFSDIYQLDMKFPFNYLSGYNYRKVGGVGLVNSKLMSTHAFGAALDINMGDYDNDYFLGRGNDLRNKNNPYCIPDEVIAIFEDYGWFWGGNYDICSDTMHFQYFELGFLQYDSSEPFPVLYRGAEDMDPIVIRNLTQRLVRLGYLEKETISFSKKVERAVRAFEEEHGLEPDGVVDYGTWEPLINLTHDMRYVF